LGYYEYVVTPYQQFRSYSGISMDNNPHTLKREDIEGSVSFRVSLLEKTCINLEKFSDELRLGQVSRAEQIETLKDSMRRHDGEIVELRKTQINETAILTERIVALKIEIGERIDGIKSANSKWFIGILATVLTSLILIIMTRWITP
jgi:hypothetical protein